MIKSLILDLTDMKHLDISAITSGLQFSQKQSASAQKDKTFKLLV